LAAKTISCTQCGAPLEIHNPRAKTAVCGSCGAQLDLTSPDYAFLGVVQREPLTQPLEVGMHGTDAAGLAWRIVGHLRFAEDSYWWDEYLVQAADGQSAWIQYDDGKFSRYTPRRLKEPLDPKTAGGRFQLDGKWHYTREVGAASISHIEGELTWKARVGDTVRWIDARDVGIEWTEKEIEVFDVASMSRAEVASLFGVDRATLKAGCYTFADDDDDDEDASSPVQLSPAQSKMLVWGIIALFFVIFLFGNNSCGGCGSSSGTYVHGYHRGYHSGGGFHFGK
jgi:hypothetical protein